MDNLGIDTVAISKSGLMTDLNPSYIDKSQYAYARNTVRNSKDGDIGTIGNEPSNLLCYTAPYKIIGVINLPDDTHLIFSTDNTNSEIGLGNPKDCSYKPLSKLACLNFNIDYPITGEAKKDFQKGIIVTFTDKYNPIRRIELNNIPTSCDDILLFKKIKQPCIDISKGQVGTMPDGVYAVTIAYSINNQIFSDWYSVTPRIMLNNLTGNNSIEISLTDLDQSFDEFNVAVIGNYIDPVTKGATKLAKNIGAFSTKIKSISVTDFINPNYLDIPLSTIVNKKNTWQKAGLITSNSNYLILGDLVKREEENYQLKAMQIEAEWVAVQVPEDYYEEDGFDIGFYRDENYDFYIQGEYNTGETTDKYHIPGRIKTKDDEGLISSPDVYEYDKQFKDCEEVKKIKRWQVENTADKIQLYNEDFKCGRRNYGHGKMGYFESIDLYPDNKYMFGDSANTPIRYHKFPDEDIIPRYQIINGKTYINILGVKFKNIPAFDNPDIIGYRITRSDRKEGNGTVVARGLMTNLRSYFDPNLKQNILYSNYTVNSLGIDPYLSGTQTYQLNGADRGFTPLKTFHQDKFNFYSPHTMFEPRYTLGSEIKIESEEVAEITGSFEKVYNHPRHKLMNKFAFWLAAGVGFIESNLVILGKVKMKSGQSTGSEIKGSVPPAVVNVDNSWQEDDYSISSIEDLISFDLVGYVTSLATSISGVRSGIAGAGKVNKIRKIIGAALKIIASLAVKIPYSVLLGIQKADEIFKIISDFTGYTDYVYQYNSHAKFTQSLSVKKGNKRRRVLRPIKYIPSDVVSIDSNVYNNWGREKTTYVELNKKIDIPKTVDTSLNTISTFGICALPTVTVKSRGSAYYATSKVVNPNQYGQLGSAHPVVMHSCILTGDTDVLFGGDCIITRFQFLKKMQFFNQNLANTNYPDGIEYDYRLYRNIAFPRFWMDTSRYDFSELLTGSIPKFSNFSKTTSNRFNLDCKPNEKEVISRISDAYMYLSNNCAMDFIVECDYNIAFRTDGKQPFYSKNNRNLSQIFRSDRIESSEEFNLNRVYSDIYTTESYVQQQRYDFNPDTKIPTNQTNAIVYSLPSFNLQKADNWQYFLPANYFSFAETDFGNLTGIHKLDQDRLIFLFSKSSPFITMGRDFLQLDNSGRKITIGDGGLFAQDPREIMPTDNNYAACTSKYAFSNTHLGRFYPSEKQGRIINYTEGLNDITREGISYWCKSYMPILLYNYFPNYPQIENPISGVGYLTAFDSSSETVYITKRDFSPKKEYIDNITFDKVFKYKGKQIELRSEYFNDISWTLSYSPTEKSFTSWHDWHPDWTIQTDTHFMTVKNNTVWKHNERTDSFCNFYGKDHPFEIEFLSSSGQQVETIRSLEYLLEVYKYKNFGRDRFHALNANFDRLIVRNTEQISPLLNLFHANPNAEENLIYPKINNSTTISWDIAYNKEENKYRINQFWDAVKDRGEFSTAESHIFPTDESGYKSVINPVALNQSKPEEERKKFRHYWNKFRLIKTISGDQKFIVKLLNIKKQISLR